MRGADLTEQALWRLVLRPSGPVPLLLTAPLVPMQEAQQAPCGERQRFVLRESQHATHVERRPSGGKGVTEHLGKDAPGLVWRCPLDKNDMSCVRASGAGLGEPSVDMELDPRKNQMLPGGSGFPASITMREVKHE